MLMMIMILLMNGLIVKNKNHSELLVAIKN
jgi:hypothetical protein